MKRSFQKRLTWAGMIAAMGFFVPGSGSANPDPNTPWIRYDGQTGDGVKCVQYVLTLCTGHNIRVDGIYGPITREGVIHLQRLFRLREDGIVGPETGEALKLVGNNKRLCVVPEFGSMEVFNVMGCQAVVPTKT